MPICHCNFYSHMLGSCVNIMAYIPFPKRSEAMGLPLEQIYRPAVPHRTLYLLHGMYEDETVWVRKSNIERYAEEKGIAVIMPAAQNSFYTDLVSGQRYFSYLTEELPMAAQSMFHLSNKREDRFIAGLSMGGYGACKAALLRPDLYSAFASLSGALDITAVAVHAQQLGQEAFFESVFGSADQFPGSDGDLFALAQQAASSGAPLPKAYIACGVDDALCYSMNQKFITHLKRLGMPFTYEEGPGDHEWDFWDTYIQRVLDWLPLA